MTSTPVNSRPSTDAVTVTRPLRGDTASQVVSAVADDPFPPDTRLGRFVLRKELGRGGMGRVYAAWDDDLQRLVAVKVMHPAVANDPEHRARFLREARAVAALAHDNVVSIFEVNQADGVAYFAMPHLNGLTLARYLADRGRPPVGAGVRIAREVASGLAAAHAVGLLHRDVKPGNIFLEAPKGRAKLLDFGLVTRAGGDGRLTDPGMVIGTPAYMSPEQARGIPLDARSDLFSLGAVLYHMFTGRLPFDGTDSMAMLTALIADTPAPVAAANPDVPAELAHLIDRLLGKTPADRPASAEQVVGELKGIERRLTAGASGAIPVPTERLVTTPPPLPSTEAAVTIPDSAVRSRGRRTRTKKRKAARRGIAPYLMVIVFVLLLGLLAGLSATVVLVGMASPPTKGTSPGEPGQDAEPSTGEHDGRPSPPSWWRPGMPPPPPPPRHPPPKR